MISLLSLASILGLAQLAWSAAHLGAALAFGRWIVKRLATEAARTPLATPPPLVSILMSLRGCDPSLRANLRNLLAQTYERYEIIVVVDHHDDEAWRVVEQVKANYDGENRLRSFVLEQPSSSCGLKCSALIQGVEKLDPASEVVMLVDADVVPYANWIRDAVGPLADSSVGVVSGTQWFSPRGCEAGSLLRSLWNAGAMVSTAVNANPWAGSCAMRTADLRASNLVSRWRESVVDDGPIKSAIETLGLRVVFQPQLIMINRDACSVRYVNRYVTRMLTWSRMYEGTFRNTAVHAIFMVGLQVACWLVLFASLFWQSWLAASWVATSLFLANVLMVAGFWAVRRSVQASIAARGEVLERLDTRKLLRLFGLLPCCQLGHLIWTVRALVVKRVTWRQITYNLLGERQVEMVAYQPYTVSAQSRDASSDSI